MLPIMHLTPITNNLGLHFILMIFFGYFEARIFIEEVYANIFLATSRHRHEKKYRNHFH